MLKVYESSDWLVIHACLPNVAPFFFSFCYEPISRSQTREHSKEENVFSKIIIDLGDTRKFDLDENLIKRGSKIIHWSFPCSKMLSYITRGRSLAVNLTMKTVFIHFSDTNGNSLNNIDASTKSLWFSQESLDHAIHHNDTILTTHETAVIPTTTTASIAPFQKTNLAKKNTVAYDR